MHWRHSLWLAALAVICLAGAPFVGAGDKDGKKPEEKELPKAVDIKGKEKLSYKLTLPADRLAEIWIESEKEGDVDLFVYSDQDPKIPRAMDNGPSKDCYVSWITAKMPKEQTFRIVIENYEAKDNRCKVKFSTKPVKRVEYKTIDLKGQSNKEFKIEFAAGKKVHFLVDSEKDTDVDLYVYNAKDDEVAGDRRLSKDCYVTWTPDKTQTYRLRVVNLGDGENRCRLSYIIEEEKKKPEK